MVSNTVKQLEKNLKTLIKKTRSFTVNVLKYWFEPHAALEYLHISRNLELLAFTLRFTAEAKTHF